MESPILQQLIETAVFLSAGIAFGLLYDVCRAARRLFGRIVQAVMDLAYVWIVGASVFILTMWVSDGQLRLFLLCVSVFGGVCYGTVCSRFMLPFFCRVLRIVAVPFVKAKKIRKRMKILFPKRKAWYKIVGNSFHQKGFQHSQPQTEEEAVAEKSGGTGDRDGNHLDACVHRGEYCYYGVQSQQSADVQTAADRRD